MYTLSPPITFVVASHICVSWARSSLNLSDPSSETLVLKHSIFGEHERIVNALLPPSVLGSVDCFFFLLLVCIQDLLQLVEGMPSRHYIVDLFINGLRVLCVFKRTLLHRKKKCISDFSWSALKCNCKTGCNCDFTLSSAVKLLQWVNVQALTNMV